MVKKMNVRPLFTPPTPPLEAKKHVFVGRGGVSVQILSRKK
jgi:hypothetical protein